MLHLDDVHARLEARVPSLAGNIGNAAQFALLVERANLPQWRAGAFILPGGLQGGLVRSATSLFIQDFAERISIVLVTRVATDPTGAKAVDELTPLIDSVAGAICGWGPDGAPGVFELVSGEMAGSQAGALIYQLDFSLPHQMRIIP